MKCWVCKRQARGFGHSDTRFKPTDPRHHPWDWVFCSRRCQDAFHALYGRWKHARTQGIPIPETDMIDATEIERACLQKCLKAFGAAAEAIGFDKPLGEYAETEALQVIGAIVTCFTNAMAAHHEMAKYPPVHGMPEGRDPLTDFSDLEDKAYWERTP
mgnify:FL=1